MGLEIAGLPEKRRKERKGMEYVGSTGKYTVQGLLL